MAKLTKAQQEELDTLRQHVAIARALAWPNFPKPVPLKRPDSYDKYIHGWIVNAYSQCVSEAWGSQSTTYRSKPDGEYASGSRSKEPIYATPQDAWLAMYHELCWEYGTALAAVLAKGRSESATQQEPTP